MENLSTKIQSVQQPNDLPTEATSPSSQDPFFRQQVKILMGQYRTDSAHDPEMYAAALAALFSDYPKNVIEFACDPRTGMSSEYKFVPQIYEAREFLNRCMAQIAVAAKPNAPRIKSQPLRVDINRPLDVANVFVRSDIPQYVAAVRLHDETGGRFSAYARAKCSDRVERDGIWVPQDWCDQLKYAAHDRRTAEAQAEVTRAAMAEKDRQEREALPVKSPGDFGN